MLKIALQKRAFFVKLSHPHFYFCKRGLQSKKTEAQTQSSQTHHGKKKVSVLQKEGKQLPFFNGYFEYSLFLKSFQTQARALLSSPKPTEPKILVQN